MEVKINNKGEMLDATIEMVDGVMVVSPKEVKFEPKDGDIVSIFDGGQVFICKEYKGNSTIYAYTGWSFYYDKIFDEGHFYADRLATEEEKQKLFDKLKEEGLVWDAEKKKLIKLKWKPKEGEAFWLPLYYPYPSEFKPISSLFNNGRDRISLDKGWCFKTKEECQEFCNRLNDAINSVKP